MWKHGQGWLGLELGLTLSLKGLPKQNSQTREQLQAELQDCTCGNGSFAGKPVPRLDLRTQWFSQKMLGVNCQ